MPKTTVIPASDLESGHVIVGDHGGLSVVTADFDGGDLLFGGIAVTTEHGTLMFDPDDEVVILAARPDAPTPLLTDGHRAEIAERLAELHAAAATASVELVFDGFRSIDSAAAALDFKMNGVTYTARCNSEGEPIISVNQEEVFSIGNADGEDDPIYEAACELIEALWYAAQDSSVHAAVLAAAVLPVD